MKGYLEKFQTEKSEKPLGGEPTKPTKAPFDGFDGDPPNGFSKISTEQDRPLTLEEKHDLLGAVEKVGPVRMYSATLGEHVWWVRDERESEDLKRQGVTEIAYTLAELRELAGKTPELLRDIHKFKVEFGATLGKVTPAGGQEDVP